MSTQVVCPLCDHVSKHANHGLAFADDDAEKIWMADHEVRPESTLAELAGHVSRLMHQRGKQTFWCPCGLMVWMEGQGWLVSFDFVARLAEAIRDAAPDDYKRLRAFLSVAQPETMNNFSKVVK